MSSTKKNVIIIGAGVGGLSTAVRLLKMGYGVDIYEATDRIGGKCRTEWLGEYAFDTGPSLLTIPAVYRDLFLKTGKRLELLAELQAVDPAFDYHFADGTQITFPNLSLPGVCDSISKTLGEKTAREWKALMERAEAIWDVSREPFIESPLLSPWKLLLRKNLVRDLRTIAPQRSLRSLTEQYTSSPYLQAIVDRYATYSGSDPRQAPAALLSIAFVESAFGAWHISGGIGRLSELLGERINELGGTIHLHSRVRKVIINRGQATGIELEDGSIAHADAIVANGDARELYEKLIPDKSRSLVSERRKLRNAERSFSGFALLLGLNNRKSSGPTPAHHTIYFPNNYQREFEEIFEERRPVTDPTIYICYPHDPKMLRGSAQEHGENWFVLVNAPLHDPENGWDWSTGGAEYAQKIISKLDHLGLNVTSRLEVAEFRTPLDLAHRTLAPGGSIYGSASNGARSTFLRARNRSPIRGLYVVGGSAHPGGGLPLVGISSEIVASLLSSDM